MVATTNGESGAKNLTAMELAGDREIVVTRAFNGPARLVFDAWTRPELVRRWWAPQSLCVEMVECDADVRAGGRYRYVLKNPDGAVMAFSGQYTEVTPHSRLVYTQVFEPTADPAEVEGLPPAIVTVTFEERGGKTYLTSRDLYPSPEVRDAVLASGMEHGMRATMDQLDELVQSLG